jgi:epothilone polyketide synthase D
MNSPAAEALLRRVGVKPLPTVTALAALDALAGSVHPLLIVADIDWPLFKGSYEARGHHRLLERMAAAETMTPAAAQVTGLMQRVNAAAEPARARLLSAAVQGEVAQVLGLPGGSLPELEQGLFEMGLDSLMAMELRTRLQTQLGRGLPATLVFDCPTIGAIARFVLGSAPPRSVPPIAPAPMAIVTATAIEAMSDADAESLLLRKLESIH